MPSTQLLTKYQNGNGLVSIYHDGTRTIEYDEKVGLQLAHPLNIDVRVSNACSFGMHPVTGMAICEFCHESARTDGRDCDYEALKDYIYQYPAGTELAIGCNKATESLEDFLWWACDIGYICNITINQGHIQRDKKLLKSWVRDQLIYGLGISYRRDFKWSVPNWVLEYDNTVFHVIIGIDDIIDVKGLKSKGVKKILVLGEKDFGFNLDMVDTDSLSHKQWRWWIPQLFKVFDVVSFDNLALEQLHLKRFFTDDNWSVFHQGEHSIYIDAVNQTISPSSRSVDIKPW